MKKDGMFWKWLVLFTLTAWSVWLAYPLNEKITLGIDLSGGYRFVLGVDYDKLTVEGGGAPTDEDRRIAQEQALEVLRNRIDTSGTKEPVIYKEPGTGRIVFEIPGVGEEERQELEDLISRPAYLEFRLVHEDNFNLVRKLHEDGVVPPGFKRVSVGNDVYFQKDNTYRRPADRTEEDEKALVANSGRVSPLYELMLSKEDVESVGELYRPFYVHITAELDGTAVRRARPEYDQYGRVQVSLRLSPEGGDRFFRITRDYAAGGPKNPGQTGRQLGIVMDDTLYSAPTIQGAIAGGSAVITGSFSYEEAATLSAALNSGALPVPVEILMQQSVDPTLGKTSIQQSVRAVIIGALAVVIFMTVYYMLAGMVVNVALIFDILLLPLGMLLAAGFLGIFSSGGGSGEMNANSLPTLTLYGIAGLVLTIGMAVDANVLIFERIREEQRAGKRFASAILAGYQKAFSTIFDANLTTLIVAVILFMQGSGPIRGFAVMLTAGIIVSMYTALVFTRMAFDTLAAKTKIQSLKMLSFVKSNINFDFVGKRFIAMGLSFLVILGTFGYIARLGSKALGVDFTGGAALLIEYDATKAAPAEDGDLQGKLPLPSEDELRGKLAAAGVGEAVIQYQTLVGGTEAVKAGKTLQVRVGFDHAETTRETLIGAYGESHGFRVDREERVGAQVGEEMRSRGLKALIFAMLGIVIYITARFEFAFAVGAIVAVLHDVLVTVGLYCLFGRQLSLPIVAALLTIVGYSVNDTIVVFDRIREDLKLLKGKSYKEIANTSINQTLSRTILTSLTTLLTVVALLVFGGGAVNDFALALFIGIVVGTYSTIFIATPVMLLWHRGDKASAA